jgi:branched-chain amino acid transport system permease protein
VTLLRSAWILAIPALAVGLGDYRGDLFAQYCLLGATASLVAFLWGRMGVLSLGQAVPFGVGAYAMGWSALRWESSGVLIGLGLGVAVAAGISLVIALVGLRGRVEVVTFALVTFTLVMAAGQLVNTLTGVTGGFDGLNDIPRFHVGAAALTPLSQRLTTGCVVAVVLLLLIRVSGSPFGGLLTMIRDAPRRAASLGYHVPLVRIAVFTGVGALTGLLGAVMATQAQSVTGDSVSITLATNLVVWALLGSRTTVGGPFAAAVGINYASSQLGNQALDWWSLGVGVLFVVAVLLAPQGVAEVIGRLLPKSLRHVPTVNPSVLEAAPGQVSAAPPDRMLWASLITCRFGPFVAVESVDLEVGIGRVHCLIGPNGAGKSTFLDVISGLHPRSTGRVWLPDGDGGEIEVAGERPWALARQGVRRKFQTPDLAPTLTVGQNLAVAARPGSSLGWMVGTRWKASVTPECLRVLRAGKLEMDVRAAALSHGQRQLLDLAMTVARPARVVLLDEPTAGLSPAETRLVGDVLRGLRDSRMLSIVMVEHDIDLVRDLADDVTVLQGGRVLVTGDMSTVEADERVREAYLGAHA